MGQKNSKGSVAIVNDNGRIRLRWTFQKKRFSLSLFQHKKENILKAKNIALQIENDLISGSFDYSLNRYKIQQSPQTEIKEKLTLVELVEKWTSYIRNRNCDTDIDYYQLRQMIKKWGDVDENSALLSFSKEKIGPKTYNGRLTLLKKFYQWGVKNNHFVVNSFEDISPKRRAKTKDEARKPFSVEEIELILKAFKHDTYCPISSRYKHSHYYSFIYFIFATGLRNAEAVGLRVAHIHLEKKVVEIKEVLARTLKGTNAAARVRKETKNGKERLIPLSDELFNILKSCIQEKKSDDLVFTSPTGLAIDDRMFQRRVFRKVLEGLKIPKRDLYACRHTFGSRCIEAGITPVMTAFLMGNNPETALRNYTHLISLPEGLPPIN